MTDQPVNAPKRFTIRIGDVPIAVESDARLPDWEILPSYRPFISDADAESVLGLHSGIPDISTDKKVLDSSPIWALHRHGDTSVFKIFENYSGLKRLLVLPPDLTRADLYFEENTTLSDNMNHRFQGRLDIKFDGKNVFYEGKVPLADF